jgi:hypothetical protein
MDWQRPIWIICERTDRGLWAEPVNLLTSLAFVAVALAAAAGWRSAERRDPAVAVLIVLVVLIGAGSTLFHTFAARWALYADLIPIQIFVGVYFFVAMRRFFGLPLPAAALATVGFVLAARLYIDWVPWSFMRGYGRLLPAVGVLFAIALTVRLRGMDAAAVRGLVGRPAREAGDLLIAASLAMGAAIVCGASDRVVCAWSPVGSHPLWHLLVAVALGLLLKAALVAGAREAALRTALADAR